MDAIELLLKDHGEAKKVMQEILSLPRHSDGNRKALFDSLKKDLLIHDNIEEKIFYPAVRANPQGNEFRLLDYEAHQVVEDLLDQLTSLPVEDDSWLPKFKVMQECLLRHVQDEEETYFPRIRQLMKPSELAELGKKMQAEKAKELQAL